MRTADSGSVPNTGRLLLLFGLLLVCVSAGNTFAAQESSAAADAIVELQDKHFRVTTVDGKRSMTLITSDAGKLLLKGYRKPCIDNVAKLNRTGAATAIDGTPLILAFLDCPAANNGGTASIVALFERTDTSTLMCFSHLELMDKSGRYFWGAVRSLEVRKLADSNYIVVPTLGGADAENRWVSYAFLHMDGQCDLTLLARFYGQTYDDGQVWCGKTVTKRFVGDTVVEIRTREKPCREPEKGLTKSSKTIDLRELLRKPELRIFEP